MANANPTAYTDARKEHIHFGISPAVIEKMHMISVKSIDQVLSKARQILRKDDIKIVAIPYDVAVMVRE